MDQSTKEVNLESLIEACKPAKKRGRPSHKRQLQEIRHERKLNLQTADSVLIAINLKSILTLDALRSLPLDRQGVLTRLLPKLDQIRTGEIGDEGGGQGELKPSETALSNEYFARFCTQYQEKLSDSKLTDEAIEQARTDTSKELAKLDPWKLKHFEPIWGQKLISQTIDDQEEEQMIERILRQKTKRKPIQKAKPTEPSITRRRVRKC